MTTRRTLIATAASAAVTGFPAILHAQGPALRFSHTDTPVGKRQLAAELFARRVEELTGGRVKVQVFHSGQLANDARSLEQLQLGGLDLAVTGTVTYATHVRALNLTALPFILETYEQGWKFYDDSPWLAATFDQLHGRGMRILSTWEAGFRSFTTRDAPINSPSDARGKKLRIAPVDMIRWIMEALGFQPVVLPVTEVYLAIQQGTVVGQENPVDTILSQRFYEVAPFITMSQHVYSPLPVAIAERVWQRLSPPDRDALMQAAKESAALSRREVRAAESDQLKEMEGKGAKVIRPVIGPFRDAMGPVHARAREQYGAEVDKVLAECEAVRRALPAA
jgi:tripartite ATP-independent transporter DctP family solute receptor